MISDFFDPNTWQQDNHEFRIYADDYGNDYAVVDEIDYHYLIQWRWKLKKSRIWPGSKKQKAYLARTAHIGSSREARVCPTLFLHTEVIERSGAVRPKTDKHLIVDHADGDEFNCKRKNLRYATIAFNNKNIFGSHERMLEDDHG